MINTNYKCEVEYINKLYNHNISLDNIIIPKEIQSIIENLEECDKIGNWIDYEKYENELETTCKNLLLNSKISEGSYNILMRRYGRYV